MIVTKLPLERMDGLLLLLSQMHNEIGHFDLDAKRMEKSVRDTLKNGHVLGLWNENKSLIGSIGLYWFRPWYTEQTVLADRWVYVDEKFRSFKAFDTLMQAAIDTAALNALPLIIQLHSVKDTARKEFLFEKYLKQTSRAYNIDATQSGGAFLHN